MINGQTFTCDLLNRVRIERALAADLTLDTKSQSLSEIDWFLDNYRTLFVTFKEKILSKATMICEVNCSSAKLIEHQF